MAKFYLNIFYKILNKFAAMAGDSVVPAKKIEKTDVEKVTQERIEQNNTDPYETVLPLATYAPWLTDRLFTDTYKIVKPHTFLDKYRSYELWQLVKESAKLKGALMEVGVWRGGSGALIAKKARLSGIKDKVYLCDTFKGVVKAGKKDPTYKGGEHADASKEIVEEIISKLKLNNIKILTGIFPEETSKFVTDETFRFCHIDVDVYQSAKDIVKWLWPKLVDGGIVVFDDYGFHGCGGVTCLVDEERSKKDRLVIHNLNGHAILIKLSRGSDRRCLFGAE